MSILQKSIGKNKRKKETSDNHYPIILHPVLASRVVELLCDPSLLLKLTGLEGFRGRCKFESFAGLQVQMFPRPYCNWLRCNSHGGLALSNFTLGLVNMRPA